MSSLPQIKKALSRLPVIGYALHWAMDVVQLPLIRLDIVREIEALKAEQRLLIGLDIAREIETLKAEQRGLIQLNIAREREIEGLKAEQRRWQELQEAQRALIVAQTAPFREAVASLDALQARIAPVEDGNGFGTAEARVKFRKQLWDMERRLASLERIAVQLHSKSATSGR